MSRAAHRQWLPLCLTYVALAAFFAIGAIQQLGDYPVAPAQAVSIYLCLLLLLGLLLAPGFEVSRSWLARRARGWRWAAGCVALFLAPYLVYAAGTGDFRPSAFGKLLAWSFPPLALFAAAPVRRPQRINWQDPLAMLWLALPILARQTGGIWNIPINLDFMARLFMVSTGAWAFLIWRGTEGTGYEFRFARLTARDAGVNFAAFAVIALPLGLALGFIAWNPQWRGAWSLVFDFVTVFLFIALPEELLFRGLLQNLLEGSWNSRYRAQVVASMLFGFTHILHAPFPNWRYVILATVAGWFYGSAYRRTRSLMASATTHALVNTVWGTWFVKAMG